MSPDLAIHVGGADPELSERLSAELTAYNAAATGASDERAFSVRVTSPSGELIAGLTGWTWGGTGGINMVWVDTAHRGDGWGGRLLAAAEAEARRVGCERMVVASFTYQAPDFYRKHGYVETGRAEGFPAGSADVHFMKRLDGGGVEPPVRLAVVVDYPSGHEARGAEYEDRVLGLLPAHGGRVEQRLRTVDGASEVQVLTFSSRAGFESFLLDEHRLALRDAYAGSTPATRIIEVGTSNS
jgi:ribosomal protein S18 acetylase RimI-like enzyme